MDLNELMSLCIEVLKDWRVIFITVFLILFISLANYVIRYRKKPMVKKPKPEPKPAAPAEAPKAEGSGDAGEEE